MNNYQESDVQANGINIHYYRSTPPGGGPTLLLVHGMTSNGLSWVRVADALREKFDVVMPDARGHGLSDRPASGYTVEDRAADLAGFIDALGLDHPILLGHSMGGETVSATAALYPERVGAVLLEDPAWFGAAGEGKIAISEETVEWWRGGILHNQGLDRETLIAEFRQGHPNWHEDEIVALADASRQMSVDALVQILDSLHGGWREWVRDIRCPILLITGDPACGVIVSPEMARECATLWKQGREVNIPGAGHDIHREKFEPYMQAVKAFLGI